MSKHAGGRPITFDVEEMLVLRAAGWSYKALGRKYNRDHTTILYHCQRQCLIVVKREDLSVVVAWPSRYKGAITVDEALGELRALKPPPPHYKYLHLLDEPINQGKSYKEYLTEATARESWYQIHAPRSPRHKKEARSRDHALDTRVV